MEEIYWNFRKFSGWIALCVGALLSLFAGFDLIEKFVTEEEPRHIAANAYVVFISFFVITAALVRQWITIRKERYANHTVKFHSILHQIRDLHTYIATKEPRGQGEQAYRDFSDNCKTLFGSILDELTALFSAITTTHCRACVKLTYEVQGRLYFYTLARDITSRQRLLRMDNERITANADALDMNQELMKIYSDANDVWYFFCNNLEKWPNFSTTSYDSYRKLEGAGKLGPWCLPYKSMIACVVRQGPFEFSQQHRSDVKGFLIVDSPSRGSFSRRYDVPLVSGIADSLYVSVVAYLDALNRPKNGPVVAPADGV